MDRDDVERLVRVEVGLTLVQEELSDHRTASEKRHEDMMAKLAIIAGKVDESQFRWSSLVTKDVVKYLLAIAAAAVAGAGGAASIVKALFEH